MKQTITDATIQLKREVAWAGQRTRLFASLACVSKPAGRDFGKATESVLKALRERQFPINIQFGIHHQSKSQRLEVAIYQLVDGTDDGTMAAKLAEVVNEARAWVEDIRFTSTPGGENGTHIVVRLFLDLPTESRIDREVAAQWSTALASGKATSAIARSQRRLGQLVQQLQEQKQRSADLEQQIAGLQKLNETLELLALVASKTDNGVIIADREGRIEWVNDSFQRMIARELPDVLGARFVDIMHGQDPTGQSAVDLKQAIQSGTAINQDVFHPGKSGETLWASLSVIPVIEGQGNITRWIGMVQDVTQQHRDQEVLNQARERAEQANQAKSDFLANVSHEIRTPMNAIIGMVELLLDSPLNSQQRDLAAIVHDSSVTLLHLLNDVLDLSKIEARQLVMKSIEFSLRDTIESAIAPFRAQTDRLGLRLTFATDEGLPDVLFGDPIRLRQILMNLVGNAVKFTTDGSISVNVEHVSTNDDSIQLRFCVQDTGIGIDRSDLGQIFQPFTQADSSATRTYGGTGLGLAICSELAQLMQGKLWVTSEVGIGSRFFFETSFALSQPSAWPPAEDPSNVAQSVPLDHVDRSEYNVPALRILVADDHSANRLLLRRILEKRHHVVDEAGDGAETLRMVQANSYDVLLLDVQMPHLDGMAVAQQIRAMADRLPQLPFIVAVTANAMIGDRERYLSQGMDDYLAKPISAPQLLSLVAKRSAIAIQNSYRIPLERLEGDRELLLEQMQYYLEDCPILIQEVTASIATADRHRLELAAHRLKGLARQFDAHEPERLSQQIETLSHAGDFQTVQHLLPDLTAAHESLAASIRRFMANRQ